jgi:hypothetical protein
MVVHKNIILKEYSNILFSRKLANIVFDQEIIADLEKKEVKFIFDFTQIETVTHSFADEFFKIIFNHIPLSEVMERTSFLNFSEFNGQILSSALKSNKTKLKDTEKSL